MSFVINSNLKIFLRGNYSTSFYSLTLTAFFFFFVVEGWRMDQGRTHQNVVWIPVKGQIQEFECKGECWALLEV